MPTTVTSGVERWLDDEERREIRLGYQAFPKQREFHLCNAKYRLFGGAAGPGKSKALLMEAVAQADEVAGSNTLLLRRTFPELEGSLLLYFRRDVPREFYCFFNEAKHTVTWRNGSTTRFGYSQSENDIYQYQSSEFLFIGIDELTHFTLRQWQFLTSRNRCPIPGSRSCMAGATNPGNIGHAWVKSLFIDKQPAPGMEPRAYDPADYAFISARVWDNPIYANDPSYLKSLQQLPDFYRRAFLDGDWSVFAGQYFTNFDPSRHVIRAEFVAAEPWWPRWISVDWGFEHPAAVYWHTSAPNSTPRPRQPVIPNLVAPSSNGGEGPAVSRPVHEIELQDEIIGPVSRRDASLYASACGASRHAARTAQLVGAPSFAGLAKGGDEQRGAGSSTSPAGHSSLITDHCFPEAQHHRPADSQTHESGMSHSANNMANPNAGDAAPLSTHTSTHTRSASLASDAAASHHFLNPNAALESPAFDGTASRASPSEPARNADGINRPPHSQAASAAASHPLAAARSPRTTVTYREFIAQHLAPRVLAAQIIERSRARDGSTEKIDAIYLSPDAFARRTDESSIAEQMGDILHAAGLPRPVPADNDRIGGWMLMYQMLDAGEWLIADSCPGLIRTLPELVRDEVHIEDIAKRDGDDAADAVRYGLKSRLPAHAARPPLEQQFRERVTSSDPTIRAIQARKAELELPGKSRVVLPRWARWRRK